MTDRELAENRQETADPLYYKDTVYFTLALGRTGTDRARHLTIEGWCAAATITVVVVVVVV